MDWNLPHQHYFSTLKPVLFLRNLQLVYLGESVNGLLTWKCETKSIEYYYFNEVGSKSSTKFLTIVAARSLTSLGGWIFYELQQTTRDNNKPRSDVIAGSHGDAIILITHFILYIFSSIPILTRAKVRRKEDLHSLQWYPTFIFTGQWP